MSKPTKLIVQEQALRLYFPNSHVTRTKDYELNWTGQITPNALSATYTLRIYHKMGQWPHVYVTDPHPLEQAAGKTKLPHVYDQKTQKLCLYYPKEKEWHSGRLYVHTLIPWAAEWLLHYELWLCTGIWSGGGIEHNEPKTSN